MPTWLNDVQALSSTENGAFISSTDPSTPFMQAPTPVPFEFNQLQGQQLQQRMQNGNARNGSPAFNPPIYQTQPVIPSKRPRPREDSLGASPGQNPGILPASRSQTPQQPPYPGYQAVNGAQQFQPPTPYQHLQQAGSSASISPIVQNQTFTPQGGAPRMQTASPSPFSPAVQNFTSQASPVHSEHGSRVNTPQNGGQPYSQSLPYAGAPNQSFSPPVGPTSTRVPTSQYIQNSQTPEQQRMYEMRMRQLQAGGVAVQHRTQGGLQNIPNNSSAQMSSPYPIGLARPQQAQPSRTMNPQVFVRTITQWMQQRGMTLDTNPTVMGQPIHVVQLFGAVVKLGGSRKVTELSQWVDVAQMLQIPQAQWSTAAHEIQSYWQANLSDYEAHWFQRQRLSMVEQMRASPNSQRGEVSNIHSQFPPVRQTEPHLHDQQRQQQFLQAHPQLQVEYQTPRRMHQHNSFQPKQNGYSTPQQGQIPIGPSNVYTPPQPGATPPHARSQAPNTRSGTTLTKRESYSGGGGNSIRYQDRAINMPRKAPLPEVFKPQIEPLAERGVLHQSHGGIQAAAWKNVVDELLEAKPNVPAIQELGVIDIRALTMSLRSGIHAEVRLALDTLATLSNQPDPPCLEECEDLVETLIECAEDQIELLAENAAEVSDAMLISSYEEIVRGCRAEVESLQEVHEFGSLECELDRSVERLICLTTILRNLSFSPANHRLLADPVVVCFLTTVIRYLGTRNMLLRTYQNTLDFTKDVVIYLSNLAQAIDLPGKEEALCILHFLLSFAPSPPPTTNGDEEVIFAPYLPNTHLYFPPAIDSLAKLLARDDPNRTFYRAIFLMDGTTVPPYDLLTRTFGLAVAPIPEYGKFNTRTILEARKPYLAQGLLAGEILAGLLPSSEHALARSWLSSQDGFALNLIKIVSGYAQVISQGPQRHPSTYIDPAGWSMIIFRGLALLRKLAEKAKDIEGRANELPPGIIPRKESLLGSLLLPALDVNVVRQLCHYSGLEN